MQLKIGLTPWRSIGTRGLQEGPASEPAFAEKALAKTSFARQAAHAESLGYWSMWLPESHFVLDAMPSPLLHIAQAAVRTERIEFGTTSLLLTVRNPILLAEELATLDHLCSGRLIVGVGRGFRKALFEVLGVDLQNKRTIFEDSLNAMLAAWSGEPLRRPIGEGSPSVGGDSQLFPLPFQQPHPPLWMAAFGPKALKQAARFSLPYLASPIESESQIRSNYQQLDSFAVDLGGTASPTKPVMRTVFVSEEHALVENVKAALEREQAAYKKLVAPVLAESLERPIDERIIVGSAAEVRQRIEGLVESLGMTHLIARCLVPGATSSDIERSVERISGFL